MNEDKVIEKLQIIFDKIFIEHVLISPELTAGDVPEWDSLMHIGLIVTIEKNFDIKFKMGEVEATKNIGEFVFLILNHINSK
jgi:acyl carrier protein